MCNQIDHQLKHAIDRLHALFGRALMVTSLSETSCRDLVGATEPDVAVTPPPAPPSMISTHQRSEPGQQARRLRRERHKKERYALLHAMTAGTERD